MTCVDQPMVRRGRWRAVLVPVFAVFGRKASSFSVLRTGQVEDLNDYMLRDIGFSDGRLTEAAMRRTAEYRGGMDQF